MSCFWGGAKMQVTPIGYGVITFYTTISYDANVGYYNPQKWGMPFTMQVDVSTLTACLPA